MSQLTYARPIEACADITEDTAVLENEPFAEGDRPVVYRRILEAMIPPGQADPELREALIDVGYDPDVGGSDLVSRRIYHAVVDVLGHALLPLGTHRERQRLMGRKLIVGFSQQPAGRVLYGGLISVGPERAISRLPMVLRFGAEGMSIEVEPLGLRNWRVRLNGSTPSMGELFCGTLLEMLAQVGVPEARATVEPTQPGRGTSVLLSWEDLGPKPFVDAE